MVDDVGGVKPVQVFRLCATFDHRLLDGARAASKVRRFRTLLTDPSTAFGPLGA